MKNQPALKKSLNLFDSTALVIGSMIGSGIFIVSADMSRTLGSPGWLMVAWIITGFLTIFAAISYGELASLMPQAGGQYVYLREAYNPLFGFLYGWTLFLVIQTGTIAAVAMAFAKFFGVLVPWFSENNILISMGSIKINYAQLLAVTSIVLLTWINTKGIKTGKYIQNGFTGIKTIVLLLFILIGLFFATNNGAVKANFSILWDAQQYSGNQFVSLTGFAVIVAIGTAMVGSLFTSVTWENLTFTSGEVINPKRNVPLGLFFGTLIVTAIYLLANLVYLNILPLRGNIEGTTAFERGMQFATNDRLATASMESVFGQYAAVIMAVFIVISTFGCNNGQVLAGARVYYAMAGDGLFFKKVGKLNAKGVPAAGLITQGIWASLLCFSGTYSQLLDYVVFAVLIFYVLTITAIFVLRIRKPHAERPYKAFGYPVVPAIYILISILIMIILLIYKPDYTWPGLIIVLMGVPVYYIWKRGKTNTSSLKS
jgi:APA family basic amino acid/polyamine antiporter